MEEEETPIAEKKYKQATSGDVIKFTRKGDKLAGTLISWEESKQFANSFAVKVKVAGEVKVVFVSSIVIDLIKSNGIKEGDEILIRYEGKKTSEKSGMDYNDYSVFYT